MADPSRPEHIDNLQKAWFGGLPSDVTEEWLRWFLDDNGIHYQSILHVAPSTDPWKAPGGAGRQQ